MQYFYSVPVIGPNKNSMEIKNIGIDNMYPSLYERRTNNMNSGNEFIFVRNMEDARKYALMEPKLTSDLVIQRNVFFNQITPKKIIYSGNKTIVIWEDGVKTIVSLAEGDQYDPYLAFCAALAKRVYGSTSATKRIINKKSSINKKTKPIHNIIEIPLDSKQAFDELSKKVRDVIRSLNKNWRDNENE